MGILNTPGLRTAVDTNNAPVAGAKLYVYNANSVDLSRIFRDYNLTDTIANPLISDANGRFPVAHVVEGTYRAEILAPSGEQLFAQADIMVGTRTDVGVAHGFTTLAEVAPDALLTYDAPGLRVAEGDLISVADKSFVYHVANPAEPNPHMVTAGGVKLLVKDGLNGCDVCAFGAVGDGVTDDTLAFQKALDAGFSLLLTAPSNEYVVSDTLRYSKSRQWIAGEGFETQIRFTGTGTFLDFDGWAGCSVRDIVVHSTTAATGIRIGPNGDRSRYPHFWRLTNVMLVGDVPNWLSTALASQRLGFSTAGFEFETCFYGHSSGCEVSLSAGPGFLLKNQTNGNIFTGASARECDTGLSIQGDQSSNGNSFHFKNVEASYANSIGIEIGEADRNYFSGRMEIAGAGSIHVRLNPPSGVAKDNNFHGLMCTGPGLGYEIGTGTGTDKVLGTMIVGGLPGSGITIHPDATETRIEATGQAVSGITFSDQGASTIYHADITASDGWYEKNGTEIAHKIISSPTDLTLDSGSKPMILRAGNNPRLTVRDDGLLQIPGNISIAGTDQGGIAGYLSITNSSNVGTARSTGTGTIKFVDGVDRDNQGFLQIRIGTAAYFIPLFNAN